MAQIIANISN